MARDLAESQSVARAMLMAGEVTVDGKIVTQVGTLVSGDAGITLTEPQRYVSRGGLKLEYALEQFRLDVSASVVADIGASTGGFTDCLLQRGASRVYAIDAGRGQLDYRLRKDPRVVVMEKTNARYPVSLPETVDLVTIDVSFISVTRIIPSVAPLLQESGCLLVLVKPQFEARRQEVGKGGIVKDPAIHARVLGRFISWLTGHGFRLGGLIASPVAGAAGNREFFLLLRKDSDR